MYTQTSTSCNYLYIKTSTSCNYLYTQTSTSTSCNNMYTQTSISTSCYYLYIKTSTSCNYLYTQASTFQHHITLSVHTNINKTSCNNMYTQTSTSTSCNYSHTQTSTSQLNICTYKHQKHHVTICTICTGTQTLSSQQHVTTRICTKNHQPPMQHHVTKCNVQKCTKINIVKRRTNNFELFLLNLQLQFFKRTIVRLKSLTILGWETERMLLLLFKNQR